MTYIEIVLIDGKSYLTKMFENELIKRRVYIFSNFVIEESSVIYLLTIHVYKITFKNESRIINIVNDRKISDNNFNFLICKAHIGWRGERSMPYKGVDTSP
ncbi:hypothetical protein AHAS_Ahas18G0233700 [Arachis hypogaea]